MMDPQPRGIDQISVRYAAPAEPTTDRLKTAARSRRKQQPLGTRTAWISRWPRECAIRPSRFASLITFSHFGISLAMRARDSSGAVADGVETKLRHLRPDVGIRHRSDDFVTQKVDDGLRRTSGRKVALHRVRLDSVQALFDQRRHIGQRGGRPASSRPTPAACRRAPDRRLEVSPSIRWACVRPERTGWQGSIH